MELRKGERGNRNIAALLILSLQALFKLGILDVCLSISKHSPLKINIILEEDYILDVCLSACSIHPLKLTEVKRLESVCLSLSVCVKLVIIQASIITILITIFFLTGPCS